MQGNALNRPFIPQLLLLLAYIVFALPQSPLLETIGYDKEVFQYIGMIIKNGQAPYVDAFDHKPPVIYILNSLGVLLTPGSTWGIFALMHIMGIFSALLVYRFALSRGKSTAFAIVTSIIYIALINSNLILQGGNLTRQLTAYLTTGILFLVLSGRPSKLNITLTGLLIGTIFLTQQNEVLGGAILGAWFVLFEKNLTFFSFRRILTNIAFFTGGILIPVAGVLLLVLYWNNFNEFINQAFLFNFNNYFEKAPLPIRVRKTLGGFYTLMQYSQLLNVIAYLTIAGFIFNMVRLRKEKVNITLLLVSLAFGVQIVSSSLSGKIHEHYYLMFIPYLSVLLVLLFNEKRSWYYSFLTAALALVVLYDSYNNLSYARPRNEILEMVTKEVEPEKNTHGQFYPLDARYLRVNFNLNITCPSRWAYTHFFDSEDALELIGDLNKHQTKFILFPLERFDYPEFPEELVAYLKANYTQVFAKGDHILYKRNSGN